MGVKWDMAKMNRYKHFRKDLRRLARKHGTSMKALASVFSDLNTGRDWRSLYHWVESPEFFRKAASGR